MEHGEITTVEFDEGIVYCNIRAVRYNVVYQGVPVLKSHSGFIQVPRQGDIVAIDELDDGTKFVQHVLARDTVHEEPNPIPKEEDLREGDITIRLDEQTELTLSKSIDDRYNISISASKDVDIDAGGYISIEAEEDINVDAENINIEANQNIDLDAAQDVVIQGIPFMDHVHETEDATINDTGDGSGSKSTTTKTSGTPQ